MKAFTQSCIDNKTGKELILSETSFNHAMSYLETKGIAVTDCRMVDGLTICKTAGRTFYYDENRGYLLGD